MSILFSVAFSKRWKYAYRFYMVPVNVVQASFEISIKKKKQIKMGIYSS